MATTMISFRADSELKQKACALFDSLGMNLTTALTMFMKQAVLQQKYPCALELEVSNGTAMSYPQGFFDLFGSGKNLGFDEEPQDLSLEAKDIVL